MALASKLLLFLAVAAPLLVVGSDSTCSTCEALALDRGREEAGGAGGSVSLLQRKGAARAEGFGGGKGSPPSGDNASQAAAAARLEAARPVAWLHVPKCGSSLENFLIHLPGMCPGVSEDLVVGPDDFGEAFLANSNLLYNWAKKRGACPGSLSNWGQHLGAGSLWDTVYEGHAVTILRQPEQRLLSAYNFKYHSWPLRQIEREPKDERDFAEYMSGCAVRMITRDGKGAHESCGGWDESQPYTLEHVRPTEEQVALAVHRIQHGFVFVGIMEEWALSICLGHRILGGSCRRADFLDSREGSHDETREDKSYDYLAEGVSLLPEVHEYDTAPLKGFRDPYDGPLYEAAKLRFSQDLERYNVSIASCQPCFAEAGVSVSG